MACDPTAVLHKIPLTLSWTRNDDGASFPLPAPVQDIATHMLVRGPIGYLSYGWIGCTASYEHPPALAYDYGEPAEPICHETAYLGMVFWFSDLNRFSRMPQLRAAHFKCPVTSVRVVVFRVLVFWYSVEWFVRI